MSSFPTSQGDTRVAILTFSNETKILKDLQSTKDIANALDEATPSDDSCNMGAGLIKAKDIFQSQSRKGVPQILVVISGGKGDDDVASPANELRRAGVLVYAVGLGRAADWSFLGAVSSAPPSAFVIEETNFPFSTNVQNVLSKQLEGSK